MLVAFAAAMWGIIGIFIHALYELGFTAPQVITVRVVSAAIMLVIYVYFKDQKLLSIQWRHTSYFIGTGIVSIVFFNWCYLITMRETSLSIAAVLLYTAPAFVTLISRALFGEALTRSKLISLLLTFGGCVLVTGYLPHMNGTVSFWGFLTGIGAGLGYALYSIFSKLALMKYHTSTVTTYTFVFASVAMIPTTRLWEAQGPVWNGDSLLAIVGLGFIPTVLAYLLYTKGLTFIESSKASIVATIEPLVAILVGVFFFSEMLTVWQLTGISLIIAAVILVQGRTALIKGF